MCKMYERKDVMKDWEEVPFEKITPRQIQYGCVCVVSLVILVAFMFGSALSSDLQMFWVMSANMAGALFLGISWGRLQSKTAKKLLIVGGCYCLWMLALELVHLRHLTGENMQRYVPRFSGSMLLCEYMMLFPMAAILNEEKKETGLKIFSVSYIAGTSLLTILAFMMYLDGMYDGLVLGGALIKKVLNCFGFVESRALMRLTFQFDNAILVSVFLIGQGLLLSRLFTARNVFLKISLVFMSVLIYLCSALTDTRAGVIMECCLLGGVVFFLLYKKKNIKSFLLSLGVAVLAIAAFYIISDKIYSYHISYYMERFPTTQKVISDMQEIRNSSQNFWSMSDRTTIWAGAIKALLSNPRNLLLGSEDARNLLSGYCYWAAHAHNSWLQIFMEYGIIGFSVAVYITWLTVKNILRIFFRKQSSMQQKIIGLTALALMGNQFFEIYLFESFYPSNVVAMPFLVCAGYIIYWGETLPDDVQVSEAIGT